MEALKNLPDQLLENKPDPNQTWERNHELIMKCFLAYLRSRKTPSVQAIADETGLSRTTIYEHLEQYKKQPSLSLISDLCSIAGNDVRMAIYRNAMENDMKAARLVAEMEGWIKTNKNINTNFINQRNNTIQVNGYELNETMVQNLRPQQLNQLIRIIKSATEQTNTGGLQTMQPEDVEII